MGHPPSSKSEQTPPTRLSNTSHTKIIHKKSENKSLDNEFISNHPLSPDMFRQPSGNSMRSRSPDSFGHNEPMIFRDIQPPKYHRSSDNDRRIVPDPSQNLLYSDNAIEKYRVYAYEYKRLVE